MAQLSDHFFIQSAIYKDDSYNLTDILYNTDHQKTKSRCLFSLKSLSLEKLYLYYL